MITNFWLSGKENVKFTNRSHDDMTKCEWKEQITTEPKNQDAVQGHTEHRKHCYNITDQEASIQNQAN